MTDRLLAALDRFIERAGAVNQKADQAKLSRKYAKLLKARFKAQRDWFVQHALPLLKHGVEESARMVYHTPLQEADDPKKKAKALSKQLDEWLEDPELRNELDVLVKLALAAGVKYVEGTITTEDLEGIDLGYEFGLENPRAIAWLAEHAFEKVSELIDQTTQDRLTTLLTDGLTEQLSYQQIAKSIRDEFTSMSTYRSEMIATNEIGNAYTQGTLAGARDLSDHGIDLEKSWLTAGDDAVEEECEENEAAGWIDFDEDFPSGDEGPLAHPNCRCALQIRKVRAEEPVEA